MTAEPDSDSLVSRYRHLIGREQVYTAPEEIGRASIRKFALALFANLPSPLMIPIRTTSMAKWLGKANIAMSLHRRRLCAQPGNITEVNSMNKAVLPIAWRCRMGSRFARVMTISSTALCGLMILSRRPGKSEISTPKAAAPGPFSLSW